MKTKTKFKTRDLTLIAMLGAICCVLMHIDFPLPFMPPFMNFDLCGLVELIGGFAMGPLQAFCIILVKILLKLATEGTSSAFTGEIQNVILSCAYVLPPVILYHRNKSKYPPRINSKVDICIIWYKKHQKGRHSHYYHVEKLLWPQFIYIVHLLPYFECLILILFFVGIDSGRINLCVTGFIKSASCLSLSYNGAYGAM